MSDYPKKLSYFLPNILTALNMGCGFISIMVTLNGEFYKACLFLILGAIFDSMDGRVARLTNTESSFGEQFDSMSDLISFGLAPALLFYHRFLSDHGRLGMALAFIFLLCGALRLARFNANIEKVSSNYFQGLPIPMSATAIISYVLFAIEFPALAEYKIIAFAYIFFYSILMISNIPFPSFKNSNWIKNNKKTVLILIFLIMASIIVREKVMLGLFISLYILLSFTYYLIHMKEFKGMFHFDDEVIK